MSNISVFLKNLPGFKLSGSHFLLGSKIHISTFYFAKRFFQNSFFASKFAFLITRYIISSHAGLKNQIKSEGLSLIGYGLYSELLISLIEDFLSKAWNISYMKINHDLVNDSEELKRIKGYEKLHQNIIIIVPIASTFSTSIKIEEILRKEFKENNEQLNILYPHINALVVYDDNSSKKIAVTNLAKKFGWQTFTDEDKKNKIVKVKTFFEDLLQNDQDENYKIQKYFVAIPSKWHDIIDCSLCFPVNETNNKLEIPLNECVLHFTDKTSVTPALIYDTPKARVISHTDQIRKFTLNPRSLSYRHIVREQNHFHYYIQIESFFTENKEAVKRWLSNNDRVSVKSSIEYKDTEYVLIFAPGHYTNTGFVNLVNELLFSNSANIIHYDPNKDHIQNFQLLYKSEIKKANKIFFVDDTITSGTTFIRTNYFLKLTREMIAAENNSDFGFNKINGFDAVILLLNRSSYFVNNNILRKLSKGSTNSQSNNGIYAFANLHLPSLKSMNSDCPLCFEKKRYDELERYSFLDRIKVHFLKKSIDLSKKELFKPDHLPSEAKTDPNRYTKRIEAIHRIYQWFSLNNNSISFYDYELFNIWVDELLKQTESPFEIPLLSFDRFNNFSDEKAVILKVLIQPPLSNYQPIRDKVFDWVITLLDNQVDKARSEIAQGELCYNTFRDLKYLVRRAGLLNANYIISQKFFDFLKDLYAPNVLKNIIVYEMKKPSLVEKKNNDLKRLYNLLEQNQQNLFDVDYTNSVNNLDKINDDIVKEIDKIKTELSILKIKFSENLMNKNIHDFNVYYAAQIKELLFLNEARSIRLEKKIINYYNQVNPPAFKQLLRILHEENSLLLIHYWEFVMKNANWNKNDIFYDFDELKIKEFLRLPVIVNHYRTKTLMEFFFAADYSGDLFTNKAFVSFLWLMNFFYVDCSDKEITNPQKNDKNKRLKLSTKTDYIFEKLKSIIAPSLSPNSEIGSFFIVKYNPTASNPYFIAYNKGASFNSIHDKWENSYIKNFLEGEKDDTQQLLSRKSIIEFSNNSGANWIDLYSHDEIIVNSLPADILDYKFNRLLLIRINKKTVGFDKGTEFNINDEAQGVIGFYFNVLGHHNNITPINTTRYLLLLRSEISNFIKRHHESNEYSDWVEADTREKTSLLTGHGKEMLIRIAENHKDYIDIISKFMLVQRLLIDSKLEDEYGVPQGDVSKIFKKMFSIQNNLINYDYFGLLKTMAKEIFQFNEIENYEEFDDVILEVDNDLQFEFPADILKMICFELFVNAKKNRWIFSEGITDIGTIQNMETIKNKIWIHAHKDGNQENLEISISNTGPKLDEITQRNPTIVKGHKTAAGIELIQTLLTEFNIGEKIEITQEPITEELYKINVKLKLFPWKTD